MDRFGRKSGSVEEAAAADRAEMWALTPGERLAIARELQLRVYGRDVPDVREGRIGVRVRKP